MTTCTCCGRPTGEIDGVCVLCRAELEARDLIVYRGAATGRVVGYELRDEVTPALARCPLCVGTEMTAAEARATIEGQAQV